MSEKQKVPGSAISTPCNHYLITLSTDELITFCNSNFGGKFLPDNASTIPIVGILSEPDVQPFREAFYTCISSPGKCVHGSSRLKNQQDEHQHIKWEMVAENKPDSNTAVYLVGYDIHETVTQKSELERSRKTLKAIFDSTDNVRFFVSPDYQIQFFNRRAYENGKLHHERKMKVGDNILDYARDTNNNIDEVFLADFHQALSGQTVVRETEIEYRKGTILWFRSEYYPVYENEQLIGISITTTDVTSQKKHEDNIRLQNEKLHKIAFIQSHQVRQPLSNIMGILSFINEEGLSEDDRYLMKILNLSAQQLDSVVRNIVIEAQHIEHEKEYFDASFNKHKL
jgi:PAS domain-containing protein